MENRIFCKNPRYLRITNKLSQEKMGEMLGFSRSTYAYLETGCKKVRITPVLKKAIFDEFGYTTDELSRIDLQDKRKLEVEENKEIAAEIDNALVALDGIATRLKEIKQRL